MTNQLNTSIGSGVIFPIQLTTLPNGLATWSTVTGDIHLVENNIRAILLFQLGQRLRQENFGTRLYEALEEQNTQLLAFLVKRFITEGINYWEPRVELLPSDITVTQHEEKLYFSIKTTLLVTKNVLDLNFSYNPQTNNLYANI